MILTEHIQIATQLSMMQGAVQGFLMNAANTTVSNSRIAYLHPQNTRTPLFKSIIYSVKATCTKQPHCWVTGHDPEITTSDEN
jgi:hypothetical protein